MDVLCAERLGREGVDRALSELKARRIEPGQTAVRHPERMLTKILKDVAKMRGLSLN